MQLDLLRECLRLRCHKRRKTDVVLTLLTLFKHLLVGFLLEEPSDVWVVFVVLEVGLAYFDNEFLLVLGSLLQLVRKVGLEINNGLLLVEELVSNEDLQESDAFESVDLGQSQLLAVDFEQLHFVHNAVFFWNLSVGQVVA